MTKTFLSILSAVLVALTASAEDKKPTPIDATLLLGRWVPKEKKEGAPTLIEFQKGGKVLLTHSVKDKEFTNEATYKLDGDKLTLTAKIADKEIQLPATVTKLTDTELTTKNDKGEERTLVRVRDKK